MSHVEKYAGVRHHYSRGVHEGNWIEDGYGETLHQLRQQNPAKLDSLTTSGRIYTPPNEGVADLRSLRGAPIRRDARAGISPDIVFPHGPEDEWTRRRMATTSGTELSSPYQADALHTAEWLTLAQYPHDTPTTRTIRLGMRQPDVPVDTITGVTVRGPPAESLVQRKRSDWSARQPRATIPRCHRPTKAATVCRPSTRQPLRMAVKQAPSSIAIPPIARKRSSPLIPSTTSPTFAEAILCGSPHSAA